MSLLLHTGCESTRLFFCTSPEQLPRDAFHVSSGVFAPIPIQRPRRTASHLSRQHRREQNLSPQALSIGAIDADKSSPGGGGARTNWKAKSGVERTDPNTVWVTARNYEKNLIALFMDKCVPQCCSNLSNCSIHIASGRDTAHSDQRSGFPCWPTCHLACHSQ